MPTFVNLHQPIRRSNFTCSDTKIGSIALSKRIVCRFIFNYVMYQRNRDFILEGFLNDYFFYCGRLRSRVNDWSLQCIR